MIRPSSLRRPLGFEHLEDRITPGLFDGIRDRVENEANQRIAEENAKRAASDAATAQQVAVQQQGVATPTDRAANPVVFFLDDKNENIKDQKLAFDSTFTGGPPFTGGMWASRGDVTGDGVVDQVVAAGAGSIPVIIVYDGVTGAKVRQFLAYEESYKGGVFVTTGDVNGDGQSDIVVGTDQGGGPRVRIFSGGENSPVLADFLAIDDPNFRGGVRVSMGDISGDGIDDLLVSAGFGGGPRIAGFDGAQLGQNKAVKLFQDFFSFEDSVRDGAYVALGFVDGDSNADLIFGGGPSGGPRVRVASGAKVLGGGGEAALRETLADFFAGSTENRGGARVGTIAGADKLARILTVGAAGDASIYDKSGKLERQLNRELVLNSGLLDDEATRHASSPISDKLAAIFDALEGSYAGVFSSDIQLASPDGSFKIRTGDVRYTIAVSEALLQPGSTFNKLKSLGGRVPFKGTATVEVGGKNPVIVEVTGEFSLDAFPNSDGPKTGRLTGMTSISSDSNLSANAGNLTWTPAGLTGSNLSGRNGPEFTVGGVGGTATLLKGAAPPAPVAPADLNANVIAALLGKYSGTYSPQVQVLPSITATTRPVTLSFDITAATASDPNGDPRLLGKQYQFTGTFTASIAGKPAQTGTITGSFVVKGFSGTGPTAGTFSFFSSSGATTASVGSPDFNWTPAGLTGSSFASSNSDFAVRAGTFVTLTKA